MICCNMSQYVKTKKERQDDKNTVRQKDKSRKRQLRTQKAPRQIPINKDELLKINYDRKTERWKDRN